MARTLYLILCVMGTVLPYSQFLPFFGEHGLDQPLFLYMREMRLDRTQSTRT